MSRKIFILCYKYHGEVCTIINYLMMIRLLFMMWCWCAIFLLNYTSFIACQYISNALLFLMMHSFNPKKSLIENYMNDFFYQSFFPLSCLQWSKERHAIKRCLLYRCFANADTYVFDYVIMKWNKKKKGRPKL